MTRLLITCAIVLITGPALAVDARVGVTGTLIPRTAIATSEQTTTAVSVSDGVTYWN